MLWTTDRVPADIHEDDNVALTTLDRSFAQGTIFRIVEYGPGVTPSRHQTDSIDYAVVLSGEIDLLVGEETVRLRAGDTLIQRATEHDWLNNGHQPCLIAFCLIGAHPRPQPDAVGNGNGDLSTGLRLSLSRPLENQASSAG